MNRVASVDVGWSPVLACCELSRAWPVPYPGARPSPLIQRRPSDVGGCDVEGFGMALLAEDLPKTRGVRAETLGHDRELDSAAPHDPCGHGFVQVQARAFVEDGVQRNPVDGIDVHSNLLVDVDGTEAIPAASVHQYTDSPCGIRVDSSKYCATITVDRKIYAHTAVQNLWKKAGAVIDAGPVSPGTTPHSKLPEAEPLSTHPEQVQV